MVNTIVSIPGYVHLYRSLLRFYDMPENEIREMLYLLNTANLDCYEYYHPERELALSGPVAFCHWLETMDCRPYRTEVQLYKSLLFLQRVNCHGFYTGFGTKPFSKEGCLITQKEVNAVFDGQVALCREILQKKTKEYTGGDTDRLGAFKAAAALQHTTPECFADGMSFDAGTWDEKITDSLNYLFLLKAIVKEGQTNQQN